LKSKEPALNTQRVHLRSIVVTLHIRIALGQIV